MALNPEYLGRIGNKDSYSRVSYFKSLYDSINSNGRIKSDADWLTFVGLKDLIPNFYLYRADRLGMANSIELRVPFLDHNFVNLALSTKGQWKTYQNEPKYIFKRSLESILSKETLYRKKQGFCVPMREWVGETMTSYIQENLNDFCQQTQLFDKKALQTQIDEANKGNKNFTNTLWTIYFLMSWFRKWLS